jgi:hypothetical protein
MMSARDARLMASVRANPTHPVGPANNLARTAHPGIGPRVFRLTTG